MEDYLRQAAEWVRKIMVREIWSDHPDNTNANSPLHDFARGMKGVGDGVPAKYAQDCFEHLKRQQRKETTVTAGGVQLSLNKNGDLVIIQTGAHYIIIPEHEVQNFMSGLRGLVPDTDVPTDANQPNVLPGSGFRNAPPTNQQLSMRQNELAAKAIKKRY